MSVRTKDELLTNVKSLLGDNLSDEGIALLEDISDTLDNSTGASTEEDKKTIEELKQQVKDTDSMWRQKYADRFLNPEGNNGNNNDSPDSSEDEPEEDNSPKQFDELFSEN